MTDNFRESDPVQVPASRLTYLILGFSAFRLKVSCRRLASMFGLLVLALSPLHGTAHRGYTRLPSAHSLPQHRHPSPLPQSVSTPFFYKSNQAAVLQYTLIVRCTFSLTGLAIIYGPMSFCVQYSVFHSFISKFYVGWGLCFYVGGWTIVSPM